jgi:hypothetical protein
LERLSADLPNSFRRILVISNKAKVSFSANSRFWLQPDPVKQPFAVGMPAPPRLVAVLSALVHRGIGSLLEQRSQAKTTQNKLVIQFTKLPLFAKTSLFLLLRW